jgi:hypothetical protein
LADVGALLNHRSVQTTHRYAHLTQTRLREATEAAGKFSAKRPSEDPPGDDFHPV